MTMAHGKDSTFMTMIHGGDTESFVQKFGYEPVDFSASCSPLGVPAGVRHAVCQMVERVDAYPDPLCRRLCRALALHEDVKPEHVWCGNGSADLIFRLVLARRPARALVLAPTFAEYERSILAAGCQVVRHPLKASDGYYLTETLLPILTPDIDMLFLCNPNNPTGHLIAAGLMQQILERCAEANILVVVDECFIALVDDPGQHTLKGCLDRYLNLLIIKAFTKLYGMAGLRLGYCLSHNQDLLTAIRHMGQPWAVSSVAQAAGLAALAELDYVDALRQTIRLEKTWLLDQLAALPVSVIGCQANWIFFYTSCLDLSDRLHKNGILIRDCSNFPGLARGHFRIAIKTRSENKLLINAMATCLREDRW